MGEAAVAGPAASGSFRFVACVADDVTRETVSRAVAHLGWPNAKVRPGGLDAARRSIDITSPPRLVLVDLAEAADPVNGIAELAQLCGPATRFLTIGAVNDVSLYRQLMALGVADYLVKPVSSDVLCDALTAALRVEEPAPSARQATRIFAFIGARGGVGTTTLAISTAWLLVHEFKLRTALVDLDLHFGNMALSLDLEPGRGLRDALEHPERTDSLLLASAMVSEGDKLPILASEEPLEEELHFDGMAVTPLLSALAQDHECLVIDLPRSLDSIGRSVIGAADATIIVSDLSLAALRDTMRIVDLSRTLQAPAKPLIIANQIGASHRGEVGQPEFERGIGGSIDIGIPFDVKAAVAVAHSGKALPAAASGSKATIEVRKLAARLAGRQEKQRSGLLSRFKK